jgi:hypothetical protein
MANWIAKATSKNKGSFRAAAKKHGMSTKSFAQKEKGASGKMGKRANLALTLMGMHGK